MGTITEMNEPKLTLEKFWAAFLKSQEEFDRRMREADRRMQETDRQMQETDRRMQETDRRMQETHRQLGELGRKFGSTVEHLVAPNLVEKFNALGFNFTQYGRNIAISDKSRNIAAEGPQRTPLLVASQNIFR